MDTKAYRPYFHITDQNIHDRVAEYYAEQTSIIYVWRPGRTLISVHKLKDVCAVLVVNLRKTLNST